MIAFLVLELVVAAVVGKLGFDAAAVVGCAFGVGEHFFAAVAVVVLFSVRCFSLWVDLCIKHWAALDSCAEIVVWTWEEVDFYGIA